MVRIRDSHMSITCRCLLSMVYLGIVLYDDHYSKKIVSWMNDLDCCQQNKQKNNKNTNLCDEKIYFIDYS